MSSRYLLTFLSSILCFCQSVACNSSCGDEQTVLDTKSSVPFVLEYHVDSLIFDSIQIGDSIYVEITIEGYGHGEEVGAPMTPCMTDFIPTITTSPSFFISDADYIEYNNVNLAPTPAPTTDTDVVTQPFLFDSLMYNRNEFYPQNIFNVIGVQKYHDGFITLLRVNPIQYNPVSRVLRVYKNIEISSNDVVRPPRRINGISSSGTCQVTNEREKYIVVTIDNYLSRLSDFLQWKRDLGFDTKVISKPAWSSFGEVRDSIISEYYRDSISIGKYLLIVGDYDDVPSELFSDTRSTINGTIIRRYASDHYLSCMGDDNDYLPELARGRIVVRNITQLDQVLSKTIRYEQEPSFLGKALHAGFFQIDGNINKECRPFIYTSEIVRNALLNEGYYAEIQREYFAEDNANPLFTRYGDSIPLELRKPYYSWNTDGVAITNYLNNGVDYALYRGHGNTDGWENVSFKNNNIGSIVYSEKSPIIFSTTCFTGQYVSVNSNMFDVSKQNCFASNYLMQANAIGVIASTSTSYSDYNDIFISNMFYSIYPNDRVKSTLSKWMSNSTIQSTISSRLGDVMNQGFLGVISKYGISNFVKHASTNSITKETFQRFHIFGDPSIEIYTDSIRDFDSCEVFRDNDSLFVNLHDVNDCTIQIIPADTMSHCYCKVQHCAGLVRLPYPEGSFKVLLTKHNYKPTWIVEDFDVYLQNKVISANKDIKGRNVYIGKNVNPNLEEGDVHLENGASLKLNGDLITIKNSFSVNHGSTLKLNSHE